MEAQRLLKLAEEKEAPKKLDTQVIFECFEGMTILYLCDFSLKIPQSLYKSWADTNLEAQTDRDGNKFENCDYRRINFLLGSKTHLEQKEHTNKKSEKVM